MNDGNFYMNELRKKRKLGSFNNVGRFLGISGNAVSIIRRGGGISEDTATKIGLALDIDPAIVYADINAARATDKDIKGFWEHISKQLGTAASIGLLISTISTPSSANSLQISKVENQFPNTIYYVKCNIDR